jgi:hypothetical protein
LQSDRIAREIYHANEVAATVCSKTQTIGYPQFDTQLAVIVPTNT